MIRVKNVTFPFIKPLNSYLDFLRYKIRKSFDSSLFPSRFYNKTNGENDELIARISVTYILDSVVKYLTYFVLRVFKN